MANPSYRYTDRLQVLLFLGILGSAIGAALTGMQLADDSDSTGMLLLGLALLCISAFVATIGATGLGVKFGQLAALEQSRLDDQANSQPPE